MLLMMHSHRTTYVGCSGGAYGERERGLPHQDPAPTDEETRGKTRRHVQRPLSLVARTAHAALTAKNHVIWVYTLAEMSTYRSCVGVSVVLWRITGFRGRSIRQMSQPKHFDYLLGSGHTVLRDGCWRGRLRFLLFFHEVIFCSGLPCSSRDILCTRDFMFLDFFILK